MNKLWQTLKNAATQTARQRELEIRNIQLTEALLKCEQSKYFGDDKDILQTVFDAGVLLGMIFSGVSPSRANARFAPYNITRRRWERARNLLRRAKITDGNLSLNHGMGKTRAYQELAKTVNLR